jgi:hypothetical protein
MQQWQLQVTAVWAVHAAAALRPLLLWSEGHQPMPAVPAGRLQQPGDGCSALAQLVVVGHVTCRDGCCLSCALQSAEYCACCFTRRHTRYLLVCRGLHVCCLAVLQAKLAGDGNCCFCIEPLPSAAVIALECQAGHFVHLSCAKTRLQVSVPIGRDTASQLKQLLMQGCLTVLRG